MIEENTYLQKKLMLQSWRGIESFAGFFVFFFFEHKV